MTQKSVMLLTMELPICLYLLMPFTKVWFGSKAKAISLTNYIKKHIKLLWVMALAFDPNWGFCSDINLLVTDSGKSIIQLKANYIQLV